jgi:DNA-binding NarL/FixJ family response regulator
MAWGLERLVQSAHPRLEVGGRCDSVADCGALLGRAAADVALLDLDFDDGAEGVSHLFAQTQVRILAISGSRDTQLHDGAVLSGARGVVE